MKICLLAGLLLMVSSHAFSNECNGYLKDTKCFKKIGFFGLFLETREIQRNRECLIYVFNYFQCKQSYIQTKLEKFEYKVKELEDNLQHSNAN